MYVMQRAGRLANQLRVIDGGCPGVSGQSADNTELGGRIQQAGPALLRCAVGHSVRRMFQIIVHVLRGWPVPWHVSMLWVCAMHVSARKQRSVDGKGTEAYLWCKLEAEKLRALLAKLRMLCRKAPRGARTRRWCMHAVTRMILVL